MASWFARHEALDAPAPPNSLWTRLKTGLGLEAEQQEEPSLLASIDQATTLNRTQVRTLALNPPDVSAVYLA